MTLDFQSSHSGSIVMLSVRLFRCFRCVSELCTEMVGFVVFV